MNAKLDRMGPSVQCADDSMILRVKGRKTLRLRVDKGEISDAFLWISGVNG